MRPNIFMQSSYTAVRMHPEPQKHLNEQLWIQVGMEIKSHDASMRMTSADFTIIDE